MQAVTIEEARKSGLSRYFTGKPCKRGHLSERGTASRACLECAALARPLHDWRGREKIKAARHAHAAENREAIAAKKRDWCERNREKVRTLKRDSAKRNRNACNERYARWCRANPDRARDIARRSADKNRGRVNATAARHRAMKRQQIPAWADLFAIKAVYADARRISAEIGVEYHVDHVIPLAGETVSGLHVETNLQIIEGRLNQSKSNRLLEIHAA